MDVPRCGDRSCPDTLGCSCRQGSSPLFRVDSVLVVSSSGSSFGISCDLAEADDSTVFRLIWDPAESDLADSTFDDLTDSRFIFGTDLIESDLANLTFVHSTDSGLRFGTHFSESDLANWVVSRFVLLSLSWQSQLLSIQLYADSVPG